MESQVAFISAAWEIVRVLLPVVAAYLLVVVSERKSDKKIEQLRRETAAAKEAVVVNKDQASVNSLAAGIEREQLVNRMASQLLAAQGTIIELVSGQAKSVERETSYQTTIVSLNGQLTEVKATLNLAYGEITRLNARVDKLLSSILSGSKPAAEEAAKQVVAEKTTPSNEPTTITQEAINQVAAAPTPNGLPLGLAAKDKPAAVAENPPVPLPTPSSSVEDKPVVVAAQVPPPT